MVEQLADVVVGDGLDAGEFFGKGTVFAAVGPAEAEGNESAHGQFAAEGGVGGDFVFAWPGAQISFTGDEVGVNVVFGRDLSTAKDPAAERKKLLARWSYESSPYKAAAKHLLDDVIDPRDTRKILSRTLEYACRKNGSLSKRLLANWPTGY